MPGQRFGRSLTGLGPGYWAVSWPGRNGGGATDAGLVSVFDWTVTEAVGWIGAEGYDVFSQSTPGVPETNQSFDRFGTQGVP